MEVRRKMKKVEQILREIYGYTEKQLLEDARQAEEEMMRGGEPKEVTEAEIQAMLERIKIIKKE